MGAAKESNLLIMDLFYEELAKEDGFIAVSRQATIEKLESGWIGCKATSLNKTKSQVSNHYIICRDTDCLFRT